MKKTPDPASILQDLRKVPSNKRCFDCQQAGTTYTIVDFGIFLCSICGGLHREFNHRVKGLSTCNFSAAEVEKLQQWGNEKATQVWMAKHDLRSYPIPDIKDQARLRDFIRLKYAEKRWYDESKAENSQRKQEPVVKAPANPPQQPPVPQPQYQTYPQPPPAQQTYAQPPPAQQAPVIKSLIDFEEEPKSTETWSGFQQPQNVPTISRPQNTQAIPKPPGQETQYQNPGQFGIFDPGYYQNQQARQPPQNSYGQTGGNTPNQYQNPQVNNGGYSPQTGNVGGNSGGFQASFPPPQNMAGNWNQAQRNQAPADTSPKVQQIPYNYQNANQASQAFPSFPPPQPQTTVPSYSSPPQPQSSVPSYSSPPQAFPNPYPQPPIQPPQTSTFPSPYQQTAQNPAQNNPFPSQYPPQPQNPQHPPQNPQHPPQNPQYPPQNPQHPPQNPQHPPQNPQLQNPQSQNAFQSQRPQPAPLTTSFPGQYSQPPLQSPPRNNYPPQSGQNPLTDVSFAPYPSQDPRNPSYPQSTGYQQAPASQDPFSQMQNNLLSSGPDPFAQLVEEEKKKAHIIHSAKPQNNSGNSNVLLQQYQMMAQMYQSTHGIPYPYTFQQWYAIVNPQPAGVPASQAHMPSQTSQAHMPSQTSHMPPQNPGYKHVETSHMHEKPKSNNPFDLFT
ncbi:unnamed protein product [Blepharisma stoltei]|uniref:Arf-GAP domain-containing protein n=1 Tax=Blepharisma stoltei TaxID=1481888 RepID=A0AAU9J2L1_9CILI|nr:unnamed protein product [Blepharisma stoltei]